MILLAIIAASVAAFAVVGMWLYTRPDIRVWLAAYLAPLQTAARKHRGRLIVGSGVAAAVLALLDDGFFAAVPIFIATVSLLLFRWVRLAAAEEALVAEGRALRLTDARIRADQARDSTLDVLAKLVAALESSEKYEVEAALDAAKWVLDGGDYTGRLRGAQNALYEDALKARPTDGERP